MLVAIGTITAVQSKFTEATAKVVEHLLYYCASHSNVTIRYTPSNMLSKVHSDALYLLVPEARSRAGGYFFLGSETDDNMNGPLLVISTILRNVMASAAEAKLGSLFENAKKAVALQVTLKELGHLQPATPIQVDNSIAHRIVNSSQFRVYWEPVRNNKADYFTKHHPPAHQKKVKGIQNPKLGIQDRTRNPAISQVVTRKE
eukprot:4044907-Ditylum_brightwellii.AAC.1